MKATLWLWSLVSTMLCISQSVYSSPLTDYRYLNSRDLQDSYLSPKRTGPSLSIVNPLDVLRQRLLLEIARRQMKENTKQVELNRQILKNVGKRDDGLYDLDYYDIDHNLLTSLNHPVDNSVYPKFQQQPPNNMSPYIHHNRDPSSAAAAIASGLVADHTKFLNENLLNTNTLNTNTNNNLLNNINNNDNAINNLMDDNNNNLDNNNNVNNNNMNDNDDDYQIKYIYSLHKNKPNNMNNNINNNNNSNKNNNYSH